MAFLTAAARLIFPSVSRNVLLYGLRPRDEARDAESSIIRLPSITLVDHRVSGSTKRAPYHLIIGHSSLHTDLN